jgi:5,10-methylene-tetrahydrofolate dehydrogenase/methenyl tetrahydrofolate cyclohydrolase
VTNLDKLLNEAKQKANLKSDYALANEIGIEKQLVSGFRHKKSLPGDFAKARIAELTNRTLIEITALIGVENEKNKLRKEYWERILKKLNKNSAIAFILLAYPITEAAYSAHCILCQIASAFTRRQVFRV